MAARKSKKHSRQHAVFPWVATAAGMELSDISPEEIANIYGMPEHVFKEYLQDEIKSEMDIISLPWAMISVVLYALVLLTHEGVGKNYTLIHAIDHDIGENANFAFSQALYMGHKNYEDVNSFADFFSFMNKGLVPLRMPTQHPAHEGASYTIGNLSTRDKGHYLWHNKRIGPMKLSQEVSDVIPCPNSVMASAYGIECTSTGFLNAEQQPVKMQAEQGFVEYTPATVWIHNASEAGQKLMDMEQGRWLNPRTNQAKVSTMVYSPDSDLLMTTHVNFIFSRTGRIWKVITHESMSLTPYPNLASYFWDVLFYTQVTFLFAFELKELCGHICQHPRKPWIGLWEYVGLWNTVDWIYILASYVVLILWVARAEKIRQVEQDLLGASSLDCPSEACEIYYAKLFATVEEVGQFVAATKVFNAIVPVVILLRMFKAFSAQPRLALVTDTLRKAWTNLAHYLIVFSAIFVSYSSMGVAFFGRETPGFTTLDRAIPTMFLMMLGNFEFDELEISGRGYAFFFFSTFMFLLVLVMLSMLIAIIMDVYVDVKQGSKSSEPVWIGAKNIMRRAIQNWRKQRLSLNHIIPVLCVEDKKLLRTESLVDSESQYFVPGLSERQARRLLTEAAKEYAATNVPNMSAEAIFKHAQAAKEALEPFAEQGQRGGARTSLSEVKSSLSESGNSETQPAAASEDAPTRNMSSASSVQQHATSTGGMSRTFSQASNLSHMAGAHSAVSPLVQELSSQVPLDVLLQAADLKIATGVGLPTVPAAAVLLSQASTAARSVMGGVLRSADI